MHDIKLIRKDPDFFSKKLIEPSFNLPLLGKPMVIKFFMFLNYLN